MRNIQVLGEMVVWCGGFNWGIGALNKKIYFGKVEEVHWLGIKKFHWEGWKSAGVSFGADSDSVSF